MSDVEDNLPIVTFITLQRCYDVLSLILKNINPADWEALMRMHDDGYFATPTPTISIGDDDDGSPGPAASDTDLHRAGD